jgi:hypothetical protein
MPARREPLNNGHFCHFDFFFVISTEGRNLEQTAILKISRRSRSSK